MLLGIFIALVIIAIWYIYVYMIFKWSTRRIAQIIVSKMSVANVSFLDGGKKMYQCKNVVVVDGREVYADLLLKDYKTLELLDTTRMKFIIKDNACGITDPNCISLS